jgi:hypothetical protein
MVPLPFITFALNSRCEPAELAKRIDRERGKAGVRILQGTVDESGFRLSSFGGVRTRSYLLVFHGEFHKTERGTAITVRLGLHLLGAAILVAIVGIGIALAFDRAMGVRGVGIAGGAFLVYAGLAWIEWWSLKSVLDKSCGKRKAFDRRERGC